MPFICSDNLSSVLAGRSEKQASLPISPDSYPVKVHWNPGERRLTRLTPVWRSACMCEDPCLPVPWHWFGAGASRPSPPRVLGQKGEGRGV